MKYKTADLEGPRLDLAVLLAQDKTKARIFNSSAGWNFPLPIYESPSTRWTDGGEIIDKARITIIAHAPGSDGNAWSAVVGAFSHYIDEQLPIPESRGGADGAMGPTALVAAMRAFVNAKFGDDVELDA